MTAKVVRSPRKPLGLAVVLIIVAAYLVVGAGRADAGPVGLGTATSYAVLAGSGVTNTGASVINGDLGSSPTGSISGFPPGLVNGTIHSADAAALQAKSDLTLAYDDAAGRGPETSIVAELGGRTLGGGVYTGATLELTGALTLDAQGDPDAVFVFKSAETIVTATDSSVVLIGGANPCNVYWQIGSSATFGVRTAFVGTVMAMQSITATTNASFQGRLLARTGAVTLDTNLITRPNCAELPAGSTTTAVPTTEAPATTAVPTTEAPATTEVPVTTAPVFVPTTAAPPVTTPDFAAPPTTAPVATFGPGVPAAPGGPTTTTGPGNDLTRGPGPDAPRTPGPDTPGMTTGDLARTGSETGRLLLIGLLSIGAGAALLVASRRRVRLV